MPPIFISYSRKDQEYTYRLVEDLQRRGFSIWIDQHIGDGESWWPEIADAIRGCSAMIVVMTENSEQSDMVRKEMILGHRENKKAFPLLLRGRGFDFFVDIQYTDVTTGELPPDKFYVLLPKEAKVDVGSLATVSLSIQIPDAVIEEHLYAHTIKRWRASKSEVNETRIGEVLGDAGELASDGGWRIQLPEPQGRGTYGPYIALQPNRYRVTFRLKIDDNTGGDEPLADIDATSRKAEKVFALQTITAQDFYSPDAYQDFHLVFELLKPEDDFEFRIRTSRGFRSRRGLTLDYVELKTQ